MTDLEVIVHEALDNAKANGYGPTPGDIQIGTPEEVARDLTDCCADLECVSPEDIEPWVKTWLTKNR